MLQDSNRGLKKDFLNRGSKKDEWQMETKPEEIPLGLRTN